MLGKIFFLNKMSCQFNSFLQIKTIKIKIVLILKIHTNKDEGAQTKQKRKSIIIKLFDNKFDNHILYTFTTSLPNQGIFKSNICS